MSEETDEDSFDAGIEGVVEALTELGQEVKALSPDERNTFRRILRKPIRSMFQLTLLEAERREAQGMPPTLESRRALNELRRLAEELIEH